MDIPQFGNAKELGVKFSNAYNDGERTFVGHSLGGGLASVAAMATEMPAITFNPAALNVKTKKLLGIDNTRTRQIQNIVVDGEIVNELQQMLGLSLDGMIKKVFDDNTEKKNAFQRHLIDTMIEILKKKE